jgi:hypothetical protein
MSEPLTADELREIRERCDRSTGGVHRVFVNPRGTGAHVYNDEERELLAVNEKHAGLDHQQCLANAEFFAAARADVGNLLAEVDRLRAELAETPPTLEWITSSFGPHDSFDGCFTYEWNTPRITLRRDVAWVHVPSRGATTCHTRAAVLAAIAKK